MTLTAAPLALPILVPVDGTARGDAGPAGGFVLYAYWPDGEAPGAGEVATALETLRGVAASALPAVQVHAALVGDPSAASAGHAATPPSGPPVSATPVSGPPMSGPPVSAGSDPAALDPAGADPDGLVVRLDDRTVTVAGREVGLPLREFELLAFLAAHPRRAYTRAELMREVWRTSGEGESRTVDVHVNRVRGKLGSHGRRIVTLRGVGYRFDAEPHEGILVA